MPKTALATVLTILSIVFMPYSIGWCQTPTSALRIAIQTKLFLVDPGTREANFAIKITMENWPMSGIAKLNVQGLDRDNFILADLSMHAMQVIANEPSSCTKRFELPEIDYQRIVKWQLADPQELHPQGHWNLESIQVRSIPHVDSPDIGTLVFRLSSRFSGSSQPDRIAVQGLDQQGFEICHFLFDKYDCEHPLGSRKGRWTVNGDAVELDAFKSVFRPVDFQTIPKLQAWKALPMEIRPQNLYGMYPWTGDEP